MKKHMFKVLSLWDSMPMCGAVWYVERAFSWKLVTCKNCQRLKKKRQRHHDIGG